MRHTVDLGLVRRGVFTAETRDVIPAIRRPVVVPAAEADHVADDEGVIGVVVGDAARAYPVFVMQRHEVVDDALGGVPLAATYCPLCDAAAAFRRTLPDPSGRAARTLTLGVSGYLFESDVLLYDAETETFWRQFDGRAVVGPLSGASLAEIPVVRSTWRAWRAAHPTTTVLSWKTEYGWPRTQYEHSLYFEYEQSNRIIKPVSRLDARLPPKTVVFGVAVGDAHVAVPETALAGRRDPLAMEAGGRALRVLPPVEGGPVRAEVREPAVAAADASAAVERWTEVPVVRCYWFAWFAFHEDTAVAGVGVPPAPAPGATAGTPGGGR